MCGPKQTPYIKKLSVVLFTIVLLYLFYESNVASINIDPRHHLTRPTGRSVRESPPDGVSSEKASSTMEAW